MSKVYNLIGKRFDRLFVVDKYGSINNRVYWNCICDCGSECIASSSVLVNGLKRSCGCLSRERSSEANLIDIVGNRYGRLVVLSKSPNRKCHDMLWLCQCDCGNQTIVSTSSLKSGSTRSCGCYRKEVTSANSRKDLAGLRFGNLTAIQSCYIRRKQVFWDCICDCGKHKDVAAVDLLRGHVVSCGCIKSGPEETIRKYLEDNKIIYQRQKQFVKCRDINPLFFDFYLPEYNMAIEYDGEYHYKQIYNVNDLEGQQRRDAIKTKYCEENDIILLRIPYWGRDNIESILMDWLFLNGEAGETDERQRDYGTCR